MKTVRKVVLIVFKQGSTDLIIRHNFLSFHKFCFSLCKNVLYEKADFSQTVSKLLRYG